MEITNEAAPKKRGRPAKAKATPEAASEDFVPDRKNFGRQKRINFDHIIGIEKNLGYEFAVINNSPRGSIEQHQARGWKLYEQGDMDSPFIDPDALDNNRTQSSYTSVPVGTAPDGEPMKAYLMFMPREQYENTILKWHAEEAQQQRGMVESGLDERVTGLGAGLQGRVTENSVSKVSE